MRIMLAAFLATLAVPTAYATAISWNFSGAPYDASMPDLGGEVIVTLDDENTAKTAKLTIDASGLPNTDVYIQYLFLNTTFDSDVGANAISVSDTAGTAAGSYQSDVSNEDGLAAGTGGSFDYRLAFFENGTDYFEGGEIFEATLTQNLNDLLVSSFFDTSVGGTAGAFEMALLIRSPDNNTNTGRPTDKRLFCRRTDTCSRHISSLGGWPRFSRLRSAQEAEVRLGFD